MHGIIPATDRQNSPGWSGKLGIQPNRGTKAHRFRTIVNLRVRLNFGKGEQGQGRPWLNRITTTCLDIKVCCFPFRESGIVANSYVNVF